ncbi:hypothetical protein ABZT49_16110 [Methylobacterium sp. EM32]|uniref:hypothetical protein n=1 Tax=Methylobacterium sp. EM32 TaxID=3163481 RepID=UPI0033B92991
MSEHNPALGAVLGLEGPLLSAIALAGAVAVLGSPNSPASSDAVHAVGFAVLDEWEDLRERWKGAVRDMGGQA